MQEFSSISVSSYEAGSLTDRLTEQSHDGWHVVAIVPTGSTVTAYLCRDAGRDVEGDAPTEPATDEPATDEPATDEPATDEPEAAPESAVAASDPEPVVAAIVPEPAAEPAVEPAAEPAPEPAASEPAASEPLSTAVDDAAETTVAESRATSAGAAPAGWYADPAGRFELRYWDGSQWTEHVSRAGQQYTDPPVA